LYVANGFSRDVSVVNGLKNTVVATIPIPGAANPFGVVFDPRASDICIGDAFGNSVNVIDDSTRTNVKAECCREINENKNLDLTRDFR